MSEDRDEATPQEIYDCVVHECSRLEGIIKARPSRMETIVYIIVAVAAASFLSSCAPAVTQLSSNRFMIECRKRYDACHREAANICRGRYQMVSDNNSTYGAPTPQGQVSGTRHTIVVDCY